MSLQLRAPAARTDVPPIDDISAARRHSLRRKPEVDQRIAEFVRHVCTGSPRKHSDSARRMITAGAGVA